MTVNGIGKTAGEQFDIILKHFFCVPEAIRCGIELIEVCGVLNVSCQMVFPHENGEKS